MLKAFTTLYSAGAESTEFRLLHKTPAAALIYAKAAAGVIIQTALSKGILFDSAVLRLKIYHIMS